MADAAHPQPEDDAAAAEPLELAKLNPFPRQMTVPGVDGRPVVIDLEVANGVVFAPGLDEAPVDSQVRMYVTAYCGAWSTTTVTTGHLPQAPEPPRRAQVFLEESQVRAMLGLAADEQLVRTVVDEVTGRLRFLVESPRLPRQPYWDGGPPVVTLPIAAYYEAGAVSWP